MTCLLKYYLVQSNIFTDNIKSTIQSGFDNHSCFYDGCFAAKNNSNVEISFTQRENVYWRYQVNNAKRFCPSFWWLFTRLTGYVSVTVSPHLVTSTSILIFHSLQKTHSTCADQEGSALVIREVVLYCLSTRFAHAVRNAAFSALYIAWTSFGSWRALGPLKFCRINIDGGHLQGLYLHGSSD